MFITARAERKKEKNHAIDWHKREQPPNPPSLTGGAGSDDIYELGGNDTLNGDVGVPGNDILNGGAGDDTFRYDFKTGGEDTILDFTLGDDFIDLIGSFPVFDLAKSNTIVALIDDRGLAGPVLGQDNLGPPWNTVVTDVPGGLEIDFGGGNVLTVLNNVTFLTPGIDIA